MNEKEKSTEKSLNKTKKTKSSICLCHIGFANRIAIGNRVGRADVFLTALLIKYT